MYLLSKEIVFPPVHVADKDGLLAIGGDLSVERLELAYKSGIFPWYNEGEPIIWYSPDPRMVLFPKDLKLEEISEDEFNEGKLKARVSFYLSKGNYATIVLKEIIKG